MSLKNSQVFVILMETFSITCLTSCPRSIPWFASAFQATPFVQTIADLNTN